MGCCKSLMFSGSTREKETERKDLSFLRATFTTAFPTALTHHKNPKNSIIRAQSAPFKIQISLPGTPTPELLYLLPNGSTTDSPSLAASCHTTLTSRLYCGNSKTPIGAPSDAKEALLSGIRASEERTAASESLGAVVSGGWKIEEGGKERKMEWNKREAKREARFVLVREGSNRGTVWAVFGKEKRSEENWEVEVGLAAVF